MRESSVLKEMISDFLAKGRLDEKKWKLESKDSIVMQGCLKELRVFREIERNRTVKTFICGDSRPCFELLLPLAAALGQKSQYLIADGMFSPGLNILLKTMKVHGVKHEIMSQRSMRTWGQLTAGTYLISADSGSYFLSGLLLALPLLKEDSVIMVEGALSEREEIEETLEIIRTYGIRIMEKINAPHPVELSKGSFIGATFRISGRQNYLYSEEE